MFPSTTEPHSLTEGAEAVVNLTALAHPPVSTYEWTREDGRPMEDDSGRVSAVGGVVTFREVERADEGFYSVKATNAEGVTMAKVKVEVMYPARLVEIMFIETSPD